MATLPIVIYMLPKFISSKSIMKMLLKTGLWGNIIGNIPMWWVPLENNLLYSSHQPSFCSLKTKFHFNPLPQQEAVSEDLIKTRWVSLMEWMQSIVLCYNKKRIRKEEVQANYLNLFSPPSAFNFSLLHSNHCHQLLNLRGWRQNAAVELHAAKKQSASCNRELHPR